MSNPTVTPFSFQTSTIRTVTLDGEHWFVAKDVCEALGYANPSDAVKQHCRGVAKRYPILDALGRTQEVRIIREPDLYRLIVGSTLPAAQEFEAWVFEEVLPTLRKTGKYGMSQAYRYNSLETDKDAGVLAHQFEGMCRLAKMFGLEGNQALLKADKAIRKLHGTSPIALLEIELKTPGNEALIIATEMSKRLNPPISVKNVNRTLAAMGLQERVEYKPNKYEWRLTEKGKNYGTYLDVGRSHSDGTPVLQIKWRESVTQLVEQHLSSN